MMIPSLRTTEQWKTESRGNVFCYHAAVAQERADGGAHQTRDTVTWRNNPSLSKPSTRNNDEQNTHTIIEELLNGLDVQ